MERYWNDHDMMSKVSKKLNGMTVSSPEGSSSQPQKTGSKVGDAPCLAVPLHDCWNMHAHKAAGLQLGCLECSLNLSDQLSTAPVSHCSLQCVQALGLRSQCCS